MFRCHDFVSYRARVGHSTHALQSLRRAHARAVLSMVSAVMCLSSNLALADASLTLTLPPSVRLANGGEVSFVEPLPLDRPGPDELNRLNSAILTDGILTHDRHFRVYVDINSISVDLQHRFYRYEFYVKPETQLGSGSGTAFLVRASPAGGFDDCYSSVKFEVKMGTLSDGGELELPVHSLAQRDFLTVPTDQSTPYSANLSSPSTIVIPIKNRLPDIGLLVERNVTANPSHPEYWKVSPVASVQDNGAGSVQLAGGGQTAVRLTLQPVPFRALTASVYPLKSGMPHESVQLKVSYKAADGGSARTLDFSVPVRFVPNIWTLMLAVIIGALTGSFGSLLDPKRVKGTTAWLATLFWSVVLSLVAEIVGAVLVAGGSKFVLFGFDLNPFEMLPAALIGLLIGLTGVRSTQKLREIVGI